MSKILNAHVTVSLRVDDDPRWWSEPNVQDKIEFDIPIEMFNSKQFGDMVQKRLVEMEKEFPDAVAEYEAEQARRKAEEEAELEVEGA